MALSCKEQLSKVEEEVLQPLDQWVNEQVEKCRNEPCKWWMLCLNKVFCWIVTTLVKVTVWVLTTVVRWVYITVCVVISLVVGILLLFTGRTDVFLQAISDLWQLIKDVFFFSVGLVIFVALYIVDKFQDVFNIQSEKRRLTEPELKALRPIFGESLPYSMIRVVDGNQGILAPAGGSPAYTMGYNIYATSPPLATIVHECVHVWQFQFGGTQYIGQSALYQLWEMLFGGADPYDWQASIGSGDNAWYLLDSVEAQAQFIEDVYTAGVFIPTGGTPNTTDGAFFQRNKTGQNEFKSSTTSVDYTSRANFAWDVVRIGSAAP